VISSKVITTNSIPANGVINSIIYQYNLIFREFIHHEVDLVKNRLLWSINIQGFLFATYGFSVQKLVGHKPERAAAKFVLALEVVVLALPIFGAVVSYISLMGVKAAQRAILSLDSQWTTLRTNYPAEERNLVPRLIEGGNLKDVPFGQIHELGLRPARWFLQVFIAAWVALFLGLLLSPVLFHLFRFWG